MMGFHGCCLWALGLLLWWVSEGALDMLAFVCECWFMIWLLLRVLSFKMIITARMIRKRFCLACSWEFVQGERMSCGFSVWWMCCLLMDFIGFMCSMNAVVVCEFMMRDFLVCSLWMWCGNHSVIVVSSVESCVFSWDCKNGARSWIICCAKRRGLTGNGRIDRCRHVRFIRWFPACRWYRWMLSWMHEMTPHSGHIMHVRDEDLRWYPVSNCWWCSQSADPVFQCRVCRNGWAMIAFITEIQEQTDNRG